MNVRSFPKAAIQNRPVEKPHRMTGLRSKAVIRVVLWRMTANDPKRSLAINTEWIDIRHFLHGIFLTLRLPMTDPIQRESSPLDWIRRNRLEAFRRLVIWSMLVGVLLYIYGEISSLDWAIQTGIWLLLAGIAAAMIFKLVAFVVGFLGK